MRDCSDAPPFPSTSSLASPSTSPFSPSPHECVVKPLDVCNAASDGVDQVRHWERLANIAASMLQGATEIHEGQLCCACKALSYLSGLLVDDTMATGHCLHEHEHEHAGKLFDRMPLKMDNAHGVCCAMNYIQLIQSWIS